MPTDEEQWKQMIHTATSRSLFSFDSTGWRVVRRANSCHWIVSITVRPDVVHNTTLEAVASGISTIEQTVNGIVRPCHISLVVVGTSN